MDGNNRNNNWGLWLSAAAGTVTAIVGGLYLYSRNSQQIVQTSTASSNTSSENTTDSSSAHKGIRNSILSFTNLIHVIEDSSQTYDTISRSTVPAYPNLSNLNALLHDIYVRFIALKNEDFKKHYEVFTSIFSTVHETMKNVDPYYRKYSSTVHYAGSHFDRLRIKKPDEFDMDIVINLPLNIREAIDSPRNSDIIIEPKAAGFVQLKTGVQFERLPMRDGSEWQTNKTAYEWKDERNYLLRSKFIHWFKSVVNRALNKHKLGSNNFACIHVRGIPYTVRTSESGPAVTLIITNNLLDFKLDVDLVPAFKFPESRWPVCRGYRNIPPECSRGWWLVVPKPNKEVTDAYDQSRSWRIALHDQERKLMYCSENLRQTIRLLKQLRDAQNMKIASYYIKTLFLWEIVQRNDAQFWQRNSPANLFKLMVQKFHAAMVEGNIPYFWNKDNNLLRGMNKNTLDSYAIILRRLLDTLDEPSNYKNVAKFMLPPADFQLYNAKFLHI